METRSALLSTLLTSETTDRVATFQINEMQVSRSPKRTFSALPNFSPRSSLSYIASLPLEHDRGCFCSDYIVYYLPIPPNNNNNKPKIPTTYQAKIKINKQNQIKNNLLRGSGLLDWRFSKMTVPVNGLLMRYVEG